MDFQTHLYRYGEMEGIPAEAGFSRVTTYATFAKETCRGRPLRDVFI